MWQRDQGRARAPCTSEPLKKKSFDIKAINHRPRAQFAPAEWWDGERYFTRDCSFARPPRSHLAPACHCDPSQHIYCAPTYYHQRWLAHGECLATVHTHKEALAPCTLVAESKQLIIKPLRVPGCSSAVLLRCSMQSGENEPVSPVPSCCDVRKWGKALETSRGASRGEALLEGE